MATAPLHLIGIVAGNAIKNSDIIRLQQMPEVKAAEMLPGCTTASQISPRSLGVARRNEQSKASSVASAQDVYQARIGRQ